jgi:hypothetical protein
MARKRNSIKYNSVGLFLTDSPAASPETDLLRFFNRVQSASISVDVSRQDVQHIGSEDFLDRKIVSEPNTTLKVDYLLTDGHEEDLLGLNFMYNGKSVYHNLKEDRSILIAIGDEPFDLTGYENRQNGYSGIDVLGLGNCYITDYSISAGVGEFPSASVSFAASNLRHSCYGSGDGGYSWLDNIEHLGYLLTQLNGYIHLQDQGKIPLGTGERYIYKGGAPIPSMDLANGGIDVEGPTMSIHGRDVQLGTGIEFQPETYKSPVSAIAPGGINVYLKNLNVGGPILSDKNKETCIDGSANIQNFKINLPFARENLYGFGSMHTYGRKMKYPQIGTISFSLLASAFNSGDFRKIFCEDEEYEMEINLNNHCDYFCYSSAERETFLKFAINNAKLDSYNLNESIGSIATVDCSFSFGVSPNNGFFISGSYHNEFLLQESEEGFILSEEGFKIPS